MLAVANLRGRHFQFTTRTYFTLVAVIAAVIALTQYTEMSWIFVLAVTVPFYIVLFLLAFLVFQPGRLAISFGVAHTLAVLPLIVLHYCLAKSFARMAVDVGIACLDLPLLIPFAAVVELAARRGVSRDEILEWGVFGVSPVLGGIMYATLGYLIARFSLIGPRRTFDASPTGK